MLQVKKDGQIVETVQPMRQDDEFMPGRGKGLIASFDMAAVPKGAFEVVVIYEGGEQRYSIDAGMRAKWIR